MSKLVYVEETKITCPIRLSFDSDDLFPWSAKFLGIETRGQTKQRCIENLQSKINYNSHLKIDADKMDNFLSNND